MITHIGIFFYCAIVGRVISQRDVNFFRAQFCDGLSHPHRQIKGQTIFLQIRAVHRKESHGGLVETVPAYRTKMVCVSGADSCLPAMVDIPSLAPEKEIQVPWFPDYDNWRRNTVSLPSNPRVLVGTMSIMESLIHKEHWCLMPAAIAHRLNRKDIMISQIADPPPDQQVFYLKRRGDMTEAMERFLRCLHQELANLAGTESYLRSI